MTAAAENAIATRWNTVSDANHTTAIAIAMRTAPLNTRVIALLYASGRLMTDDS